KLRFTLRANPDTIQLAALLPRLAPMTTPMACTKGIRPALTKPINVIVVEVDDCIMAVKTAPEPKARQGVPVKRTSPLFNDCPAKATSPRDNSIIPIKNRPTPPISGKSTSNIGIHGVKLGRIEARFYQSW